MKSARSFLIYALSFSLVSVSFLSFATQTIHAQDSRIALQRGYRTGYSDGYMSGYRDVIDNAAKSYDRHSEYAKADRAYSKDYGTVEDYRDGYQQGFESGYNTGYEKRSFDATIPNELNKRGVITPKIIAATTVEEKTVEKTVAEPIAPAPTVEAQVTKTTTVETQVSENTPPATTSEQSPVITSPSIDVSAKPPVITTRAENITSAPSSETAISIPRDTELIIELLDDINTEKSSVGDKFQARVVSPDELNGAIIEGRVAKIQLPGRIKRRAEVTLSFDRIVLSPERWSNFSAVITEVLPRKGDNVKRIDTEGTIEGQRMYKEDSIKVGASTGTGLVIGAIAGGPVGAAVGAGVGAAFGVGAVVVERGKHIRLDKAQQLRIKSAYETQIR
ncbi:MAG: hypothetical protein ACR2HG_04895 [Pyrinomonadaceae bacterium]